MRRNGDLVDFVGRTRTRCSIGQVACRVFDFDCYYYLTFSLVVS